MSKNFIDEERIPFNYEGVVGKALLEYRTGVNNHCASYDPFGLCNIMECLYCDNCYYKITMENGEAISNTDVDFNTFIVNSRGFDDDNHEILFYDYVPKIDDLFSYLFDENSEFKILRTSDNIVMINHVKSPKKIKITEAMRKDVLEHPERYINCPPRIRMGNFYTDEEYERYAEESLSKPLPGDEKKGKKLLLKRKIKEINTNE